MKDLEKWKMDQLQWEKSSRKFVGRVIDIENTPVVANGEGIGGEMDWEFGVNRCKLLYREQINKVLLYITGNYIQYPMINHKEKNIKKNVYRPRVCFTNANQPT